MSTARSALFFPLLFALLAGRSALAHGGHGDDSNSADGDSYVQKHMASEHHIGAFDLASFFHLHDLDRNGVLDRSEIEAIYGVHHSTSIKHSESYEVHDAKADRIVAEVLKRLDKNGDGMITKSEFVNGGASGLPKFDDLGGLGHHYDEESEYFVHHEEIYHNTPETQGDDAYTHPEDLDHFAHHAAIEHEEENRERHAQGMPSLEEEERSHGKAMGGNGMTVEQALKAQRIGEHEYVDNAHEQYTFKSPDTNEKVQEGHDVEQSNLANSQHPDPVGSQKVGSADAAGTPGYETAEQMAKRLAKAKFEATKKAPYGSDGWAAPRKVEDRLRKNVPYKKMQYKIKKSYFGEF